LKIHAIWIKPKSINFSLLWNYKLAQYNVLRTLLKTYQAISMNVMIPGQFFVLLFYCVIKTGIITLDFSRFAQSFIKVINSILKKRGLGK
jgi:hypothetical protein